MPTWVDKSECDGCGPGNPSDGVRLCEDCYRDAMWRELHDTRVAIAVIDLLRDGQDRSIRKITHELRERAVGFKRPDLHRIIHSLTDAGYIARLYIGSGQTIYGGMTSAQPKFDSEPERLFWQANDRLGRPLRPLTAQHPVGRYRLDFALVDEKRAIEVDGLAWHNGQESFVKDRERQRRLEMEGWRVLRFAAKEIMDDADTCVRQAAEWAAA